MRKKIRFRPILGEKLEDRTVPSALGVKVLVGPQEGLPGGGSGGSGGSGGFGGSGGGTFSPIGGGGGGGGGGGMIGGCGGGSGGGGSATSTLLAQDARAVQSAYQTFDGSYLYAVSQLRLTVSTTSTPPGPSTARLTAFDSAIATAITTLNTSISTDLANLTKTGAGIITTITAPATTSPASPGGYTAQLQAEIDSAATGLANSTNASVLSMNQEVNTYLRSAENQTNTAITTDAPTGTVTAPTVKAYQTATNTAYSAFHAAIASAEATAISASVTLDPTATATAVSNLQKAVNAAIKNLGLAAANDPTSTVDGLLTGTGGLQSALTSITAPVLGSATSARAFSRAVTAAIQSAEQAINVDVMTAIQANNASLL